MLPGADGGQGLKSQRRDVPIADAVRLSTQRVPMNRGYTLLWRKIWANARLCERGRKFSRLEAWLYLTNVLAPGSRPDPVRKLTLDLFALSRPGAEASRVL